MPPRRSNRRRVNAGPSKRRRTDGSPERVGIASTETAATEDGHLNSEHEGTSGNATGVSQPTIQSEPSFENFVDFEKILTASEVIQEKNVASSSIQGQPTLKSPIFSCNEEIIRLGVDEIFSHVPAQLCQKIWANEYINLALLLKNSVELQDFFSSGVLHLTGGGHLETRPESTAKDKVSNIEKWTDAFLIFSSIYLKRYPNKSQELLQYMSIIREAASRSSTLSWRSYDEQFRLRQALSVQSWGKINSDLWLRVMTSSTTQSTITNVGQTDLHTKGTCFDFNDGFCGRMNCKFSHVCSHCSASSHGRVTCFKAGYTSSNRGGPNFRRFRPFARNARGIRPFTRRGNRQ